MQRYKEISVADVFELIMKNEIDCIYYQNKNKGLNKAKLDSWYFSDFPKFKWFKREEIE